MKGQAGFGKTVNVVMNLILGACISIVMLVATGASVTADALVGSWLASFCIGYTIGDLVPIASAGPAICGALKVRNPVAFYVVSSIVLGLCFGTGILLGMAVINALAASGWGAVLGFFWGFWPLVVASAIGFVLAFLWLAQLIAKRVSGFDPAETALADGQPS